MGREAEQLWDTFTRFVVNFFDVNYNVYFKSLCNSFVCGTNVINVLQVQILTSDNKCPYTKISKL